MNKILKKAWTWVFFLFAVKARGTVMFLSHGASSKTELSGCCSVGNRLMCFSRNCTCSALCFIFHIRFHCLFHKTISGLALGSSGNISEDMCFIPCRMWYWWGPFETWTCPSLCLKTCLSSLVWSLICSLDWIALGFATLISMMPWNRCFRKMATSSYLSR